MGFWKGLGKAAMGAAEATGGTLIGASRLAGELPARNIMKSPGKVAAALGVGAASGALIADTAGEDPKKGAMAMGTAAGVGAGYLGAAGAITTLGSGVAGMAVGGIGAVGALGGKMIKMPGKDVKLGLDNLGEIKMSKFGVGVLGAGILLSSGAKAYKTLEKSRMGTNDGMLRSATPVMPQPQQELNGRQTSYANNASATGDLVFALRNNR